MNWTGGAADLTTYFVIRTAANGLATVGATITDIDLTYTRTGAAAVKVDATALGAVDDPHDANKAIEVDGVNAKGLYRVDWPDAAVAAGVVQVTLTVTLAGSFTEHKEVDIDPPIGAVASVTGAVGSVAGNVDGSVGSVAGAVGSVAGNVDGSVASVAGNVDGSVGSVAGAVGSVGAGGIVAATFAAGALDANALNADAATEIGVAYGARTITAGGVATIDHMTKVVYGMATGKFALSGNALTVYDDDGVTELTTLTITAAERTPS